MIGLYTQQPLLRCQFNILTDEFHHHTTGVIPDQIHCVFEEELLHLEGALRFLGDRGEVLSGGTQVLLEVAREVNFYRVYALKQVFGFRSYAET